MIEVITRAEQTVYSQVAEAAFKTLSLCGEAAVELETVDEEEIRRFNKAHRGVDKATDVLSFPLLEEIKPFTPENYPYDYDRESGRVNLGGILICEAFAERQAAEYGHSVQREKAYLFLHGLLHLLGYDHIDEKDKAAMRAAEEQILRSVNLTR